MKRLTGLLLSFLMMVTTLCFPSISFGATEVVPVYLNNKAITFAANDAQPQIFQNRTYVPIRTTCDALGLTIGTQKLKHLHSQEKALLLLIQCVLR